MLLRLPARLELSRFVSSFNHLVDYGRNDCMTRSTTCLRRARRAAGLASQTSSLTVALKAMQDAAQKDLASADAQMSKARLLRPTRPEEDDPNIAAALRERGGLPDPEQAYLTGGIENIDDFAACKIARKEDWVDLYAKPYYFGCEADDRMNAVAFGRNNPFGSKLNAIFSSDIGHFDVIDMRHPLPEAYELVEDDQITAQDFRDFTFANAVRLWGTQNPKFFEGTRVAKQAAAVLAAAQTPTLAAAE